MKHRITRIATLATALLASGTVGLAPRQADRLSINGQDTFADTVMLHGVALPAKLAKVSAPLEEPITTIAVREGQRVEVGDELVRIDDRVARATLAVAESRAKATGQVNVARAGLEAAQADLDRVRDLTDRGAAGGSELAEAQIEVRRAEAMLESAQEAAVLSEAEAELQRQRANRHIIRAPFAGTIARINAQIGEIHPSDSPVLIIADLSILRVEFHLPASLYSGVRIGDDVTLHASEPAQRLLRARLAIVEPIIDPATRTFRCIFEIDNRELKLPSGFTTTIDEADIAKMRDRSRQTFVNVPTDGTSG